MKSSLAVKGQIQELTFTYAEEWPGLLESVAGHVHRAPLVRKLRAFAFPGLQVERGPDDVENVESQDAPVSCRFAPSRKDKRYDAENCWCYQPLGVHAEPSEVHGDLHPEVLTDVIWNATQLRQFLIDTNLVTTSIYNSRIYNSLLAGHRLLKTLIFCPIRQQSTLLGFI